jgi:hypothetical protein
VAQFTGVRGHAGLSRVGPSGTKARERDVRTDPALISKSRDFPSPLDFLSFPHRFRPHSDRSVDGFIFGGFHDRLGAVSYFLLIGWVD